MKIKIPGFGYVDIQDLQQDVYAAKEKGLSGKFAFTPETVQGLIDSLQKSRNNNDKRGKS